MHMMKIFYSRVKFDYVVKLPDRAGLLLVLSDIYKYFNVRFICWRDINDWFNLQMSKTITF